jgi:hypothetical protein
VGGPDCRMPQPTALPAALTGVVQELRAEEGVRAVFLSGSHARGEANPFSDVDVQVLVAAEEQVRSDTRYRDGVLFSMERSTVAHRERAFGDAETALWNLTALRSGQALHDPGGVFAALQARALAFAWAEVEAQAHARAAQLIAGGVEEAHKVMGGLSEHGSGAEGKVAYACLGLTLALGTAALLDTGTLIPTENKYLTLARDAWADARWQDAYGDLAGLTGKDVRARGHAALSAFGRAVALTRWTGGPDAELAHEAARRTATFLGGG